jgi:hypothetical protein
MNGTVTRLGPLGSFALVAALALTLLACSGSSGQVQAEAATAPALTAMSPEEAVRLQIEAGGETYAGDCAATRSPEDIGKVCSKLIDERDGMRAYLTGLTFSEFSTWVFVEQTNAGWTATASTPLDFFATSLEIPWPR